MMTFGERTAPWICVVVILIAAIAVVLVREREKPSEDRDDCWKAVERQAADDQRLRTQIVEQYEQLLSEERRARELAEQQLASFGQR